MFIQSLLPLEPSPSPPLEERAGERRPSSQVLPFVGSMRAPNESGMKPANAPESPPLLPVRSHAESLAARVEPPTNERSHASGRPASIAPLTPALSPLRGEGGDSATFIGRMPLFF